ncbi:MAG: hypothetical protein ABIV94_04500, partial [Acidimicrobiales bacterium]
MSDVAPPASAQGGRARRPKEPTGKSLRRRLVRHYLPLALASAAALAVCLNLSFFDANRYPPPPDIFTEGVTGALPGDGYPPTGSGDRSQHEGMPMPSSDPQ